MPLNNVKIQQAKPKDRPYKLADTHSLYLHVQPNGNKYWRYRYLWCGKEKTLSLGVFPLVQLAEAREKRDVARKLKAQFIDPCEDRKQQKLKVIADNENTFEATAREWHARKCNAKSDYYAKQIMQRLEKTFSPLLGAGRSPASLAWKSSKWRTRLQIGVYSRRIVRELTGQIPKRQSHTHRVNELFGINELKHLSREKALPNFIALAGSNHKFIDELKKWMPANLNPKIYDVYCDPDWDSKNKDIVL